MIGKTQHQVQASSLPQPHTERQLPVQFPISVIGIVLVDDIRNETEGKGTVYAVAFAMAEASQPNERICDFLHNSTAKIRIISVTFKQARQILSFFFC